MSDSDMKKQGTKAWLSPVGRPIWNQGHITGAEKILGVDFGDDLMGAYEAMYISGFIRIQLDGYNLFFNHGKTQTPKPKQTRWIKDFAIINQLVPINGDTNRELSLEHLDTDVYLDEDPKNHEVFMENEGNSAFDNVIKGIKENQK